MQCGDLERYLEAFLDGRLGRARSGLLRRHLAACGTCRHRYEALREFERDLNRRLRAMDACQSVWAGLELDLVRSAQSALTQVEGRPRALLPSLPSLSLPAPLPSRERPPQPARTVTRQGIASRLVGIVLLVAAVGTIVQIGRGLAPGGIDDGEVTLQSRLDSLKAPSPPEELVDGDPEAVRAWLAAWLGELPPALPQVPGFQLTGAQVQGKGDQRVGIVHFRVGDSTASLYLSPLHGRDHAQAASSLEEALSSIKGPAWIGDGFVYAVSSPLGAETVEPLRLPVGTGAL